MKATSSRHLSITWTNCVRVCSISVALSFCSLAPSSARADEIEPLSSVEFDAETLNAVTNLARTFVARSSSGDVTQAVNQILAILSQTAATLTSAQGVTYSLLRETPYIGLHRDSPTLGYGLVRALSEDWSNNSGTMPRETSFLYELQRAIYGRSGTPSQSQSLLPVLWRMESAIAEPTNYLVRILGSLNQLEYMGQNVTGWEAYWTNELVPMHAIMDAVRSTEYTNAWNVALVGDQWSDIRDYLQGLTGSTADSSDYLQGLTISADTNTTLQTSIAGDLDALRRGLLTETDSLSDVEEHADTVSEYVDDEVQTNALAALTITPGDAGDLSPVLYLVDPDSFDVLPSLSGGDPVVQVFTASRDSNLPAFSIDFSLPSGFRTFVHAVCVWIWRMLFFLAMWRLVNEEFGYWSTLGGSAG